MKISTKITRTVVAVVGGFAAFTLAACGPTGGPDAGSAATVTPTATASPSTTAPAPTATTEPATISPSPTTPPATTTAPPTTPAPKKTTARPAVRHTTAPAVHRTTAPAPKKTTAPAKKKTAVCSIRSNAGNCYTAGQFCRKADLGASTTDASGRRITCKMVSGKPHWHY